MKEKLLRFVCLATAVVSGGWLAFYGWMMYQVNRYMDSVPDSLPGEVGIIGGADGPTAVFVATTGPDWDLVIVGAALVISLLGYWLLKRKKPKA